MTQARTASYGVATPPPLHHWMHAVLMLFVSLVHGVATTLRMWRKIEPRDWHTQSEASALPQAKSDIHLKEKSGTASLRLAVDAQRRNNRCCSPQSTPHQPKSSSGLTRGSFFKANAKNALAKRKQDSRVKPENDSNGDATTDLEADIFVRVPGGGRGPVLRAAQTPATEAR